MTARRGPDIQWVMLATGDSDFGPVFRRLRELGKGVVGVGPSSVLSSSVALSCHEFIFTDDDNNRSGSAKKGRGKGVRGGGGQERGATATWAGMGMGMGMGGRTASPRPRMATPPQLLSARGGFKFKRQPRAGGSGGGLAAGHRHAPDRGGERGVSTSPLLIGGPPPPPPPPPAQVEAALPAAFGVGTGPVIDWAAMPSLSTPPPPQPPPPPPPPSSQLDLSAAFARVALEGEALPPAEPVLSPGQLLLPGMVTAASSAAAAAAAATSPSPSPPPVSLAPPAPAAADVGSPDRIFGAQDHSWQTSSEDFGGGTSSGGGGGGRGREDLLLPPAFSGLGALSVIRPSEKLYRHLLAVDSSSGSGAAAAAGGGTGSLASDWGNGLSEVAVAKGLVSLAGACGAGEHGERSWAVEATLGGFSASLSSDGGSDAASVGSGGDFGGGAGGGGLGREEAFRVASLLQRCGFLSWVAKEQQWLVTVPADVEVLRRRRDEVMMEELLTRCQEAGVPFDPALAANLLWSRG